MLVGSFISLLLVAFLVSFVYFYQRRHFAFLREKQEIQSRFQEELLKTRLEIQEETFRSISEEIHDNIGQTLSFIKLNLNTITVQLPEKDNTKWQESKELLTKVIQDLRNLSRTLNTDFIQNIGLVNAIKQQLMLLERTGLYRISLNVLGERMSLSAAKELVLYRVTQELLNNSVKHADAAVIGVTIHYHLDKLIINVEDDGKGFDPEQPGLPEKASLAEKNSPPEKNGLGLRNVRNRIAMIGGTVDLRTAPDAGTHITIIVSLLNENDHGKI